MQFQVAKSDLEDALQVVTPGLGTRGVAGHFVFRKTPDDRVEVVTLNGQVFASSPLIAKVVTFGEAESFTIEGKRLRKWLENVQDSALTFTFDEETSEVSVKAVKGKQTFQSLQPDGRYSWETLLQAAKASGEPSAQGFDQALNYAKNFLSNKETEHPELCICEVRKGNLYASDLKCVVKISLPGLEASSLRLHGRDIPGVREFLKTCGDEGVQLLEHDRALVLKRSDGAIFGANRLQASMPVIDVRREDPKVTWEFSKSELKESVGFLQAGAPEEDHRITFRPSEAPNAVVLSMHSATGKNTELEVPCSVTEHSDLSPTGFQLDVQVLMRVLSAVKDDGIVFEVVDKASGRGLVQVPYTNEGAEYLTLMIWLR